MKFNIPEVENKVSFLSTVTAKESVVMVDPDGDDVVVTLEDGLESSDVLDAILIEGEDSEYVYVVIGNRVVVDREDDMTDFIDTYGQGIGVVGSNVKLKLK